MKTLLFILLCLTGFSAFISGILMVSSPDGRILQLPASLLQGTPFANYLVPGILLAGLVGGINLVAVFYNLQRHPLRYNWAIAGGVTLAGWILMQVLLLEVVHWLHVIFLAFGLLSVLLAWQLKGKWAV